MLFWIYCFFNHKKIQNLNAWKTTPPEMDPHWFHPLYDWSDFWLPWTMCFFFFDGKKKAQKSLCFRCLVHFFLGGEREREPGCARAPMSNVWGTGRSPSHQCFFKKESQVVFESWACLFYHLLVLSLCSAPYHTVFQNFVPPSGPGCTIFLCPTPSRLGGLLGKLPIKCSLVVSNIFYFHPCLGKIPNLTSIFFRWVETTS